MRHSVIAAVLAASGPAIAAPPTWDAWVGEFQGTLVWRQCTAPGEKVVAIAIDAVDGAIAIDLTSAGAALRRFSLQQDAAASLEAQDGDLSVRVAQKKPNTIDLVIAYDSGCTARGQLARARTGVPACDALVGWTRIANACTKVLVEAEPIASTWKKSDAPRCKARADRLALAMIEAGCAPHPDAQIGTRAVACRSLAEATRSLARCGRVPHEIMQRLATNASALAAAAMTAEPSTRSFVEQQCKDARADVAGTAVQFQCHL